MVPERAHRFRAARFGLAQRHWAQQPRLPYIPNLKFHKSVKCESMCPFAGFSISVWAMFSFA